MIIPAMITNILRFVEIQETSSFYCQHCDPRGLLLSVVLELLLKCSRASMTGVAAKLLYDNNSNVCHSVVSPLLHSHIQSNVYFLTVSHFCSIYLFLFPLLSYVALHLWCSIIANIFSFRKRQSRQTSANSNIR